MGKETVLHKFAGSPSDGANPNAALVNVNGTLYGTTSQGGTNGEYCVQGGCGTVFSITASRSERVLHFFTDGKDGALPRGLVVVKGSLYGATFSGGDSTCKNGEQCGVIYRIDTDGSYNYASPLYQPQRQFQFGLGPAECAAYLCKRCIVRHDGLWRNPRRPMLGFPAVESCLARP